MASPNLVTSVRRAVRAMHWLSESDQATVVLAIRLAKAIEEGDRLDARLGSQLLEALKELGGTPAARRALGAEQEAKGRLAEIRALRTAQ